MVSWVLKSRPRSFSADCTLQQKGERETLPGTGGYWWRRRVGIGSGDRIELRANELCFLHRALQAVGDDEGDGVMGDAEEIEAAGASGNDPEPVESLVVADPIRAPILRTPSADPLG